MIFHIIDSVNFFPMSAQISYYAAAKIFGAAVSEVHEEQLRAGEESDHRNVSSEEFGDEGLLVPSVRGGLAGGKGKRSSSEKLSVCPSAGGNVPARIREALTSPGHLADDPRHGEDSHQQEQRRRRRGGGDSNSIPNSCNTQKQLLLFPLYSILLYNKCFL